MWAPVVLALVSCALVSAQDRNVLQVAEDLGATEFLRLVTLAGLDETLSEAGPYTVFVPTNDAWANLSPRVKEQLEDDSNRLSQLLQFHVHSGIVQSNSLSNEQLVTTLVMDHPLRVNVYDTDDGSVVTAVGSPIVQADQAASNGVVHILSRVMYPVPWSTITNVVKISPPFSTLLTALQVTGLDSTLDTAGPFTVFAPINDAFDALPNGCMDKLLSNTSLLADVLSYHVVSGTYFTAGMEDGDSLPSVEGSNLNFMRDERGQAIVNNVNIILPDFAMTNGVIHVTTGVLLPSSALDQLMAD